MALTATIDYSVLNDGKNILFKDDTTYGDGTTDPSREQSLVNFGVYFMRGGTPQEITLNYDPETATQVLADITSDGWYRLILTITNNPDGDWEGAPYSYQSTVDLLVTDRYCACLATFMKRFNNCPCGCENPADLLHLMEMQARFTGIEKMVSQNDINSADQSLEVLEKQCSLYNEDCGC
jgi:hypothetical protein